MNGSYGPSLLLCPLSPFPSSLSLEEFGLSKCSFCILYAMEGSLFSTSRGKGKGAQFETLSISHTLSLNRDMEGMEGGSSVSTRKVEREKESTLREGTAMGLLEEGFIERNTSELALYF